MSALRLDSVNTTYPNGAWAVRDLGVAIDDRAPVLVGPIGPDARIGRSVRSIRGGVAMDFEVSEQMETILTMVREFVDNELVPIEGEMLHGSPETVQELVVAAQAKVRQMGLWAPNHPEEFGGLGLSMVDHGLLSEALGRSPLGHTVFGSQAPDAGNIEILHLHATDEQRERFLRPLVDGSIRSCFSMTEPETAGSNPLLLETTAVKDGDDYVINGQKWFTSSADGATFAIVMAVTDPEAPPYARTSMIIVPTDTPGFNLVRNVSVMGHAGSGHASHGEVIYQSCRVPQSNLLGSEGDGFVIAQERLGPGRIHHCMRWLGIAGRSFDMMCERANAARDHPRRRDARRPSGDPALGGRARRRDPRSTPADVACGVGDRPTRPEGGARRNLRDQVLGGEHDAEGRRHGNPGTRRPRRHRRHDPGVLVSPRACRPYL